MSYRPTSPRRVPFGRPLLGWWMFWGVRISERCDFRYRCRRLELMDLEFSYCLSFYLSIRWLVTNTMPKAAQYLLVFGGDNNSKKMKNALKVLNTLVILGSVAIIAVLSIELLSPTTILDQDDVLNSQLVVCVVFLADFFVRLWVSEHKWRYLKRNWVFLLVSVPYMNIVHYSGVELSAGLYFVLRLMPLVRGGYGIAVVISYLTRSKLTTLFLTYIVTIIATTYFASLVFYSLEKGVNSSVTDFGDALWWAFMDVTTVGSNIYATTSVGRVLSVVLAAAGMMMFPIFTVYITSHFSALTKSDAGGEKEKP